VVFNWLRRACPGDLNIAGVIMRLQLLKTTLLFAFIATLLISGLAQSQDTAMKDSAPKKRLLSPATRRGFIGGESHDSYVIRGRKGQILTVSLSWPRKQHRRAEFTITESPNYFSSEPLHFGRASSDGRHWSGRIPTTRDYYVYVVAHPDAHYILRATLR
jgi:hypothetical protein